MGKPKVSAEVSQEEMEAYKAEAQRLGFNLSEWIRRALNSNLPKSPPPAVADVAFAQLDEPGQTGMSLLLEGPTAASRPAPAPQQEATQAFPKLPTQPPVTGAHPCIYLRLGAPGILGSGEVQGTCDHGTQRGKPCFWPAQTAARSCSVFALRYNLRAKPVAPKPSYRR